MQYEMQSVPGYTQRNVSEVNKRSKNFPLKQLPEMLSTVKLVYGIICSKCKKVVYIGKQIDLERSTILFLLIFRNISDIFIKYSIFIFHNRRPCS